MNTCSWLWNIRTQISAEHTTQQEQTSYCILPVLCILLYKDQILYFYFSFITSQLHYRLMSRPNTAQENKITITMTKNRIVSVLSVKPCLVNCNNVLYPIWHSSKMYLLCISLWNNNTANIFNVFWFPHMVKQIDQPDVNFYKQPSEPQKQ